MKSIDKIFMQKLSILLYINLLMFIFTFSVNLYVRSITVVQVVENDGVQSIETIRKFEEYFDLMTICSFGFIIFIFLLTIIYYQFYMNRFTNNFKIFARSVEMNRDTFVKNTTDLQELEDIATAFNRKVTEIDDLHSKRDLYLNNLIHDLKGPLQLLRGNICMYKQVNSNDQFITQIEEEVSDLEERIHKHLILDKIDMFETPHFTNVNINSLLAEKVRKYNYITMVEFSYDKLYKISIDQEMFVKVIDNLFDNSFKYKSDGPIEIVLKNNKMIVANNVKRCITTNIFDVTEKQKSEGTGFGSQIVTKYCKMNNLNVYSTTEGNKFCVVVEFEGINDVKENSNC